MRITNLKSYFKIAFDNLEALYPVTLKIFILLSHISYQFSNSIVTNQINKYQHCDKAG